jgi:hypothetical protein
MLNETGVAAGAQIQAELTINGNPVSYQAPSYPWPHVALSMSLKLAVGDVIGARIYSSVATSYKLNEFTATRSGSGPKGDVGPQGPSGATTPTESNFRLYTLLTSWAVAGFAPSMPTAGAFSGDAAAYSISSDKIVVRDAGTYTISVHQVSVASATRSLFQILVNGVVQVQPDTSNITGGGGVGVSTTATITLKLAAMAEIQIQAWSPLVGNGSGALSIVRNVQGQPGPAGPPGSQVPTTYTATGVTPDRAINVGATTLNEVAMVLGTLINDMKAAGLIAP